MSVAGCAASTIITKWQTKIRIDFQTAEKNENGIVPKYERISEYNKNDRRTTGLKVDSQPRPNDASKYFTHGMIYNMMS